MIDFLVNIFNAFYNILPDSFIQNMDLIEKENFQLFADFLNFLNWIVPFDIASNIMLVWLPCILLYYIASSTRTVIKRLLRIFIDNL